MNIAIVGLGKLGAPIAAIMAGGGHDVVGVDVSQATVDAINDGVAPVREPQLQEWITRYRHRLCATTSIAKAVVACDATFIIVPTPSDHTGAFSLDYVLAASRSVGIALRDKREFHLVVLCSTVMPGSTQGSVLPALEESAAGRCGEQFGLCYNPEFIALGSVMQDMRRPDMVLIGESDPRSGDMLVNIHHSICESNPSIARMNFVNAEIAKLSVNTFVTTKISYANMLAELCETLPGADVEVVTGAIGADSRIGRRYLRGALGYGGPCFPRDNVALATLFRRNGAEPTIAEATDQINLRQVTRLLNLTLRHLYEGGTVGILGLAYKPNTDVVENSPGLALARQLLARGVPVVVHDPAAMANGQALLQGKVTFAETAQSCASLADVLVITTAWPQFRNISLPVATSPDRTTTVIDCWRMLREVGTRVTYVTLGVGPKDAAADRSIDNPTVFAKGA